MPSFSLRTIRQRALGTSSTVVAAVTLRSLRSFFIAFDFSSLKIQLRLIGVTSRAAMTQKFFPTQTEV